MGASFFFWKLDRVRRGDVADRLPLPQSPEGEGLLGAAGEADGQLIRGELRGEPRGLLSTLCCNSIHGQR